MLYYNMVQEILFGQLGITYLNTCRQGSLATNTPSTPAKASPSFTPSSEETNGQEPQAQIRPSSLPEKLNGPCSVSPVADVPSENQCDLPDGAGDGPNGMTPEEVVGKLDLKFHHTHLW